MRKLLAILAVCTAVLGCDSRNGGGTAPFASELGRYALATVDGRALPAQIVPRVVNSTEAIVADSIVLTSGGNARRIQYIRRITNLTDTSVTSFAATGSYTITRDSINLPQEFDFERGRYSSGVLTLTSQGGFVYIYRR